MRTCLKCNIKIADHTDVCPLCHQVLKQDAPTGEARYPEIEKKRQRMKTAVRICWLAAIAAFVVLRILAVNLQFARPWDWMVGGCLLYLMMTFHVSFLGRRGYQFKMVIQTVTALLLVILIDAILGFNGWSVNYVLPTVFVLIDVAVLILMIVNSRNWQSYLPIQILVILFSLAGVVLYRVGIIQSWMPVSFGFAVVCLIFLGTLLVGGGRAIQELRRRFHI